MNVIELLTYGKPIRTRCHLNHLDWAAIVRGFLRTSQIYMVANLSKNNLKLERRMQCFDLIRKDTVKNTVQVTLTYY